MKKITVVITDPAPIAILNEPCTHRRVTIDLTPGQAKQLELRRTGTSSGTPIHEFYGIALFEDQQS